MSFGILIFHEKLINEPRENIYVYKINLEKEYKMQIPLWETVWKFLQKLKIGLSYDPTISLLGIYPKELKSRS